MAKKCERTGAPDVVSRKTTRSQDPVVSNFVKKVEASVVVFVIEQLSRYLQMGLKAEFHFAAAVLW